MVVDKPSGLPSQPTRSGDDSVLTRLKESRPYVGLHHRLDTPASGLLVLAVHRRANRGLAAGFAEHRIERAYQAVLYGTATEGAWVRPIEGRPARSSVEVVATGVGLTAARLTLATGRKHQLRIHAALAGTPICGDRRYGEEAARRWPRLALHAALLGLEHPITGAPCRWTRPLPDDLAPLWQEVTG